MAAITRYNRNREMKEFDRMMNRFFSSDMKMPSVDIMDKDKEYLIKAELAGFDKSDVSVSVEKHSITISADSKEDKEKKDGKNYLLRERSTTSFSRTFTLPEDADEEKIEAAFKHGILTLVIPKIVKSEPEVKKIEVKSES